MGLPRARSATSRRPSAATAPPTRARPQARAPRRLARGGDGTDQSTSLWLATEGTTERPALARSTKADVCVIGAGIAGLSAAYLLAVAGRSVVLLDDGPVGGGQSGRTSAHLSAAMDVSYQTIARLHGARGAQLAAESHTAAIAQIESIARRERIACDFARVDGFLFLPRDEPPAMLERELEAVRAAGLTAVEWLPRVPGLAYETGPCLRYPAQAQFHPLKYLGGVARAIERHGGRIHGRSHADGVDGDGPFRVRTAHGRVVTADAAVVATNTPIVNLASIHLKQAAYLTYVVGARVPAGAVPAALYWDTEDPYHYVRLQRTGRGRGAHDVLIVGGEDQKTGRADEADVARRHDALEAWARERFPMIERVEYRWSGQVMNSLDGLAFIGRNPGGPDGVYVATGDTGMGLTHGTIAGMLLGDLILGRESPWRDLYDPSRLILRTAPDLLKQNLAVAARYVDRLTPGEVSSADEVAPGAGAVMRRGLGKVAVYRDPDGTLHERSAICPHLGCVVAWNGAERTWDCPCHGSRFDAVGRVINGPANVDLPKLDRK